MAKKRRIRNDLKNNNDRCGDVLASMVDLLESARRASARAVNSVMTATYWEIGRRIVVLGQEGQERAEYEELVGIELSMKRQSASAKTAHERTAVQRQIEATVREIDSLVYELYGLKGEEIRLVEEATAR